MPVPTDPYNFTNGTTADGEQVDARFAALYAALAGGLDASNVSAASLTEALLAAGATGPAKGAVGAYRTTDAAVVDGATITLDAEEFDVSGWFNTATGLYTPQIAGYYRISWQVEGSVTDPNTGTVFRSILEKNGATHKYGSLFHREDGGLPPASAGSAVVVANGSTDAFGLTIYSAFVTPWIIAGGASRTYFHADLIGRS